VRRIYDYLDLHPTDFYGFAISLLLVILLAPPIVVALWRWALKP
jgi:hypothetical protein